MPRETLRIGTLFSRRGSYETVGRAMHAGAQLAIEEVNADPALPFTLDALAPDPGGDNARYFECAREMLAGGAVSHVVGCYTSSSRKEILPLFEKHDALLWYPSHYEGFETNDNVIYTGAAPNQHVIPLTRYLIEDGRRCGCLVGSNYIWAWENNRIMREALHSAGGAVLCERYVPVGEVDLSGVVRQVLERRPDFVFNTLIGESAYAFYRAFRAAARAEGFDQAREMPMASCSLAEPELRRIGEDCAGHLSSSVYFSTVDTAQNRRFTAGWRRRFGALGLTSADAEASYLAVHLLAAALARAGDARFDRVRAAACGLSFAAPQGPVRIDPENRHCHMRPRIGRSCADGTFELLYEAAAPVRPDPYLVWEPAITAAAPAPPRPKLRLVP